MIFSSLEFIFIFLPLFLILYFVSPTKYKNYVLLIGSIIFYIIGAWEHPHYVLLLGIAILLNYIIGKKLEKNKNKKISKKVLTFGACSDIINIVAERHKQNSDEAWPGSSVG